MNPIIEHIKNKYSISLAISKDFDNDTISDNDLKNFELFLSDKDDFFLVALEAVASVSKSTAIGIALIDGFLSIEEAVRVSKFEQNYQTEESGEVEGVHDVSESYEIMIFSAAKNLVNLKNFK
jgi:ATP synthase mitochondrial F1 complex assembly factor 2